MKMKRNRPRAFPAIAWRIIALALALWLSLAGFLTWAAAADMVRQIDWLQDTYASALSSRGYYSEDALPGELEVETLKRTTLPYMVFRLEDFLPIMESHWPDGGYGSTDWIWGKWDLLYGFESSAITVDKASGVTLSSGNYLFFSYTTEENWQAQNTAALGQAYVDADSIPGGVDALSKLLPDDPGSWLGYVTFLDAMRLKGYFEGSEFHAVSIDRGNYDGIPSSTVDTLDSFNAMDRSGKVEWINLVTAQEPQDRELVTIYAWDLSGTTHEEKEVTADGVTYSGLTELLEAFVTNSTDYTNTAGNLLETIMIYRLDLEDDYGGYTYAIAVRCWPLQYAAFRLIKFYVVSFLAVGVCVFLILRRIRRNLTTPLEEVVESISDNGIIRPDARWAESFAMECFYTDTVLQRSETKAELQQLRTALDYAKDAEENRRQLVSNLTHELKTPLAVIHSYAEGLQSGIAEDKKEQYLNVILEETEKMDAMVLQMLDLSRLEAGKVRMSPAPISLLRLAQAEAEKFAPLMESKDLTLHYDLAEDFLITADEARITQAITNLMSNAIKYTPPGGSIRIKVFTHKKAAHFYIQNTSAPLSEEALQKVWNSFYRADPSRTEPGTGLGLTIVKTIIELHRGTCYARNVHNYGLEFGFSLPMG